MALLGRGVLSQPFQEQKEGVLSKPFKNRKGEFTQPFKNNLELKERSLTSNRGSEGGVAQMNFLTILPLNHRAQTWKDSEERGEADGRQGVCGYPWTGTPVTGKEFGISRLP